MIISEQFLKIQNPTWGLDFDQKDTFLKLDIILGISGKTDITRFNFNDFLSDRYEQISVLYGASGSGKTTLLRFLQKYLIVKNNFNVNDILYYSCQNLSGYEELNQTIKIFLDLRKKSPELVVILDEIDKVNDWLKGIKYLFHAGRLKNVKLIISLSSNFSKKTIDFAPYNVFFLPTQSFSSFVNILNPSLALENAESRAKNQGKLNYYLDAYLLTGGFMPAIFNYLEQGSIPQIYYDNYIYQLNSIFTSQGRQSILLRQILSQIILNLGTPIGFNTIARQTKAKTHLTVAEYLNMLESSLLIKQVCQSDDQGKPTTRKAKKVYFLDPFYFWLFYSYVHCALDYWQFSRSELHNPDVGFSLVENLVFCHLYKNRQSSLNDDEIMYFKGSRRRQAFNFIIRTKDGVKPILIKYFQDPDQSDINSINRFSRNGGLIISQNESRTENGVMIVPLLEFLLNKCDFLFF